MGARVSVTALACTLALATACTSEGERPDEPTAAETAAVLADAAAATDSQDPARTLPALVETVADWLTQAGHSPARIKTERYGGTGTRP